MGNTLKLEAVASAGSPAEGDVTPAPESAGAERSPPAPHGDAAAHARRLAPECCSNRSGMPNVRIAIPVGADIRASIHPSIPLHRPSKLRRLLGAHHRASPPTAAERFAAPSLAAMASLFPEATAAALRLLRAPCWHAAPLADLCHGGRGRARAAGGTATLPLSQRSPSAGSMMTMAPFGRGGDPPGPLHRHLLQVPGGVWASVRFPTV